MHRVIHATIFRRQACSRAQQKGKDRARGREQLYAALSEQRERAREALVAGLRAEWVARLTELRLPDVARHLRTVDLEGYQPSTRDRPRVVAGWAAFGRALRRVGRPAPIQSKGWLIIFNTGAQCNTGAAIRKGLATLVDAKFSDHLPLYRLEDILALSRVPFTKHPV